MLELLLIKCKFMKQHSFTLQLNMNVLYKPFDEADCKICSEDDCREPTSLFVALLSMLLKNSSASAASSGSSEEKKVKLIQVK